MGDLEREREREREREVMRYVKVLSVYHFVGSVICCTNI